MVTKIACPAIVLLMVLDEAERQIAAGETIPDEEAWKKYEEEFEYEEAIAV